MTNIAQPCCSTPTTSNERATSDRSIGVLQLTRVMSSSFADQKRRTAPCARLSPMSLFITNGRFDSTVQFKGTDMRAENTSSID